MKLLLCLVSSVFVAYGCKPTNEYQAKIDDSDTRKTVEQKKQEETGKPGTKLFNITKLIDEDTDDGSLVIIPIAFSLEIEKLNVLEKTATFIDFLIGSTNIDDDTKIVLKIKDLRHTHKQEPIQKVKLVQDRIHKLFRGKNKHGSYSIGFRKPDDKFPTNFGSLFYFSKKTGGSYAAVLAKETTNPHRLTRYERAWMLGNIVAYYSEGHIDHNRYVEYRYLRSDESEQYRLKWEDERFSTIRKTSRLGETRQPRRGEVIPRADEPNYVSNEALVDSRIYEITEKIKEEVAPKKQL